MRYKQAILYVLSGTGNSFRTAHWMKEVLVRQGIATEITMIDQADVKGDLPVDVLPSTLVGVVFPTHGFMPPWSMIKFLLNMPRRKGISAICAATRGAIKIKGLIIPGIAGLANYIAALILLMRGFHIKGFFSLDMPANMLNLHWGMLRKNSQVVMDKGRKKVQQQMTRFLEGKGLLFTRNNLIELAWGLLLIFLVPLFPLMYLILGRIYMGKLMYSDYRCVSCGLCARSCPNHAIEMKPFGKRRRPFWTFHCEVCMRCMAYCPMGAVEAGHSWGALLFLITSVPVITWLLVQLKGLFPYIPAFSGYWVQQAINLLYILPAMMIAYRLFWLITRIRFMNKLFTFTTLTRFFRRYHEPDTSIFDLRKNEK